MVAVVMLTKFWTPNLLAALVACSFAALVCAGLPMRVTRRLAAGIVMLGVFGAMTDAIYYWPYPWWPWCFC
jgi:hypothetical protein